MSQLNYLCMFHNLSILKVYLCMFLQVKIQGQSQEMLASACELFLGKSENEIRKVAQETLEGHQRAIMGNMTVEV